MKDCKKCLIRKPLDGFYVRRDTKDGRTGTCKQCAQQRALAWKRANPEAVRERRRLSRAANRETARAYAKLYRENNREKVRAMGRKWQDANRDYRQEAHLKRKFGLTLEEYNYIFESQGGVCAVCRFPSESRLRVDHDHRTGIVRGLLCNGCNIGIGSLKDNPAILESARDYVRADGTRKLWLQPPSDYFGVD